MAWYKLCDNGETRTSDYRFSVKTKSDPMLLGLKQNIALHNKEVRKRLREENRETDNKYEWYSLMRVRIMSRGPRAVHAVANGLYPRAYDSFIPHELAEYFDVYAGIDSYANYKFNEEIRYGASKSELDQITDLRYKANAIKNNIIQRARQEEIVKAWKENTGLSYHEWMVAGLSFGNDIPYPQEMVELSHEMVKALKEYPNNTYMNNDGEIVEKRHDYFRRVDQIRANLDNY